jgi:hypothetical protein
MSQDKITTAAAIIPLITGHHSTIENMQIFYNFGASPAFRQSLQYSDSERFLLSQVRHFLDCSQLIAFVGITASGWARLARLRSKPYNLNPQILQNHSCKVGLYGSMWSGIIKP